MKKLSIATMVAVIAALLVATVAFAMFTNGNFEAGDFTGWLKDTANQNGGILVGPPPSYVPHAAASVDDMFIVNTAWMNTNFGGGITCDPYTNGNVCLPYAGNDSAVVNYLGDNGNLNKLSQQGLVAGGDVGADGMYHIFFTYAPVLDKGSHTAHDQPFMYVKLTRVRAGSPDKVLFDKFSYPDDGNPNWLWNTSITSIAYMNWQVYDLTYAPADLGPGDTLTLDVVAAGCVYTAGAHWGYVYVDEFGPVSPSGSTAPSISSLSPSSGPDSGGTSVTIVGSHFTGATAVSIGTSTLLAGSFTIVDDTHITFTTPANTAGVVDVSVINPGGSAVYPSGFTYLAIPAPTITSIVPNSGPTTGGTSVVITGTGFTGATVFTFGGTAATCTVDSDTQVTCTSPAHTTGAVDVAITAPGGTATSVGGFTYTPTVYNLTVVSGTYNYPSGTPAMDIATGLTATSTPAGGTLDGAIAVIGAGFQAGDTLSATDSGGVTSSYNAANGVLTLSGTADVSVYQTVLASVKFSTASTNTTPRTVTYSLGTALPYGSTGHFFEFVSFGTPTWAASNTAASARSYFGRTGYLATLNDAGENNFAATKIGGAGAWVGGSDAATEGTWQWVTGPEAGTTFCIGNLSCAVQSGWYVNWNAGEPNDSGNEDYLQFLSGGSGMWNDLSGVAVPSITGYVVEYGGMAGDSPMTIQGSVTVNVVNAPTITSIVPNTGPVTGGTTVVLTGTNFTGGTVTFGGLAATCTVDSATQITCTTPAHAAGPVDVVVTTPGGTATSTGGFTYYEVPIIAAGGIAPNVGPVAGGTSITITGTFLTGGTFTIDGLPLLSCVVNPAGTQATCVTPPHAAGPVNIVVTTLGGTATSGFTYIDQAITGLVPNSGPTMGGTTVVITGTGFTGSTAFTFGGTAATCTVDSDTQITCTSPAHSAGPVDVVVTTPTGAATSAGGFTYIPATLTISAAGPATVRPGDQYVYTFNYTTNVKPFSAQVLFTLPGHATYVSNTGGYTCAPAAGVVTCTLGAITTNGSFTVTVLVDKLKKVNTPLTLAMASYSISDNGAAVANGLVTVTANTLTPFADVLFGNEKLDYVQAVWAYGITSGCLATYPLTYCPDVNIPREQMAVFIERGIHGGSYDPGILPLTFTDTNFAKYWIEALRADGITAGCNPGSTLYCPGSPITRAQMAVFLLRGKYGASFVPSGVTVPTWTDVPLTYWAAQWTYRLGADGISYGCGRGEFCPDSYVNRGEMAVLVQRTFSLPMPTP